MPRKAVLAYQRLVHDVGWFCAQWRGGCGARLDDTFDPERGEPCPHCGVYAVTRYRAIEPEPEKTS